ncbi:hypothetical protein [Campylobacter ureolyticus]|uniref:hypothetical protein n=1 Tax=Campylobacter ureolyticus TaxID=827 RepID=UPI0022B50784|nr:hypothetical protein [Campylobacter ureolyticus]MCZ6169431.1 hypothetical protein [Campylobacter ureolyticus]
MFNFFQDQCVVYTKKELKEAVNSGRKTIIVKNSDLAKEILKHSKKYNIEYCFGSASLVLWLLAISFLGIGLLKAIDKGYNIEVSGDPNGELSVKLQAKQ